MAKHSSALKEPQCAATLSVCVNGPLSCVCCWRILVTRGKGLKIFGFGFWSGCLGTVDQLVLCYEHFSNWGSGFDLVMWELFKATVYRLSLGIFNFFLWNEQINFHQLRHAAERHWFSGECVMKSGTNFSVTSTTFCHRSEQFCSKEAHHLDFVLFSSLWWMVSFGCFLVICGLWENIL